jgi:DNA-damage-inducible protein J
MTNKDKALSFAPLVPNAETIDAMKAARRGELVTVGSPADLLKSLNAGD